MPPQRTHRAIAAAPRRAPSPTPQKRALAPPAKAAPPAKVSPETLAAAPAAAPPPPRVRAFCLDCGFEVDDADAVHQFHARRLLGARVGGDASSRVASVEISLVNTEGGYQRISTGIPGFDRVLGGGLVVNGVVAIDGPPGIGKSTLLASAAGMIARRGLGVLIIHGEETASQVAAAARRIGHAADGVRVLATQSLDAGFAEIRALEEAGFAVHVVIVDSVQSQRVARQSSPTGSQWMVGAVGEDLRVHAKTHHRAIIAVSQVTKDGDMAGPKALEHAVDTVLSFGRNDADTRFLRTKKNRFGPVGVISQFDMTARGLREVEDPSLIAWRDLIGDPGVAACVCAHLAKPLVVPVEALVVPVEDGSGGGRGIQTSGVAVDRVRFVLESLARHTEISLAKTSVRVHVPQVGGEDVDDPGLDLAIAAACWSSLERRSLGGMVLWGAISLSGKLKSVPRVDARLEYAEQIRAVAAIAGHPQGIAPPARLPVVAVPHIADLIDGMEAIRGRYVPAEAQRPLRTRPEASRREARSDGREARVDARRDEAPGADEARPGEGAEEREERPREGEGPAPWEG